MLRDEYPRYLRDTPSQPSDRHFLRRRRPDSRQTTSPSGLSEEELQEPIVIPRYRLVNFKQFKNRYSDYDKRYAIEAYVTKTRTTSELLDDFRQEKERRSAPQLRSFDEIARELRTLEQQRIKDEETSKIPEGGFIQRVRIQSQHVLQYLLECEHATSNNRHSFEDSASVTFIRPFRMLIFFQGRMKEALNVLEDKWSDLEKEQSKKDTAALEEMRCYISFVDQHIMPISRVTKGGKGFATRVCFDDLWLFFKPGQNIISTSKKRIVKVRDNEREKEKWEPYQHVWRVCSVSTPSLWDRLTEVPVNTKLSNLPTIADVQDDTEYDSQARKSFHIRCFYLDYNGSSWQPVFTRFTIPPYDDEIDVTSLPCYPLQYCHNSEQILTELAIIGKRFQNAVIDKRFYYSGITLERTPDGAPFESERGRGRYGDIPDRHLPFKRSAKRSGKLIESEVVVDFEETYMNSPSLRPKFIPLRSLKITRTWQTEDDPVPIYVWDGVNRNRLRSTRDLVHTDDPVASLEAEEWIDSTSITRWHSEPDVTVQAHYCRSEEESEDHGKKTGSVKKERGFLKEDDLVLTPTRVCGYAFKEKGFFMLDLRKLQPISHQRGVFESLKIPKEYKEMVRSLVSSHFEKKKIERLLNERSEGSIDQDIIKGKGKGLVILLHGVPGVGKTATAEAVAKENQKPLFTVTYGDFGTNPSELEETLEALFHLANRWDCVLLFDEADVFLAERSRTELKRNALVSVFLRVLEYYHGILFLTTNRVGSIDEAFKSRLHMMLYYPPLDRPQTIAIFKANIAKLKAIERQRQLVVDTPTLRIDEDSILRFAERHCDNGLPDGGRWNGRQIKNAFQIAASMAHYTARVTDSELQLQSRKDGSDESKSNATVPVLDDTHFMKVAKATHDFDQYITQARGFNDAKWAKMGSLRNDEFQPGVAPGHFPARNSPAPHPTHVSGGAVGGYGGYGTGPTVDSYQPGLQFQAEGNNYANRGRSNQRGQAGYKEYDTSGVQYPGGHQSQPRFQDPYRHHSSEHMGQGTMPSRSPGRGTTSSHGPGLRPPPSREEYGMPAQRGGGYERYSEVPRPAIHDEDGEDAYT
ncbi:hypothetical protein QBC32DRAFT_205952 [Pseudoneurospora amorphoporcata]|uniref:AAA+ ATPase domain-containing protein n=1 Tax=Pseudoneurospora amorphoporcata TaxID=241081 RepID=A0AAN6P027_9PEZI|nr:hypothetical protein QBC32DRAFT_205952 [Pseudoneurospora amorphoporcata]